MTVIIFISNSIYSVCNDKKSYNMNPSSNNTLLKAARISGTILAAVILLVAIAIALDSAGKPGPGLSTYNTILFMFMGLGTAGLILALWKECWGAIVSLLGFLVFNSLAAVNPTPGSGYTILLLLPIVPSILYLYWCWLNKQPKDKNIVNT
jgi:hypothetical protein